jgi:PIN domain nuclease of toxin-antitoxin system
VNDDNIVTDASAIIALLVGEPITRFDPERFSGAAISAVNLSEVLARLQEFGTPEGNAVAAVARLDLRVVPFDEPQARIAARLLSATRRAGLSLGDRACLALGAQLGCPVVTADRVWAKLGLALEIVVIR